jgi:alpha-tubulin suppressor-like RCC1 family protein
MSLRQQNLGSIIKPGFNPLAQGTPSYTYYLYDWGRNSSGELGLGNITNYSSPKQVGSLTDWLTVAGGYNFGAAIKTDGTLWTWGANNYGQLGLGVTTKYSSPKQVGALTNWLSVASTYTSCAAVKTNGTLWTWGDNRYYTLATGNSTAYSSPIQIGALTNWSQLACDNYNVLAIKTDGTLWAWGSNYWGNLGLGSRGNYYSSPAQVGTLTTWANVACGGSVSMAIKTDGTVWIWGYNGYGNLGLGNITTNYSSPKQIGSLTNWSKISSADSQTVHSIKTDGTLWAWGYNGVGQLGTGDITNVKSPVQVGALSNWSTIKHSHDSAYALQTNGTLWSWGLNDYGQLGVGNRTNYSSPKQVGSLTNWGNVFVTRSYSAYAFAY